MTNGISTGSFYCEITLTGSSPNGSIGVNVGSFTTSDYPGSDITTWGYLNNGSSGYIYHNGAALSGTLTLLAVGTVVGILINATAGTVSWYNNGVLQYTVSSLSEPIYPCVGGAGYVVQYTANFGATPFVYQPATSPGVSGYSGYSSTVAGTSGYSGYSSTVAGTSGYSGYSSTSGYSGYSSSSHGSLLVYKVLTSGAGTYTYNSNTNSVILEMVGGGGGGGGANASTSNCSPAGGGGAGGYMQIYIPKANLPASSNYSVGTGGTGGTNNGANGSPGGATVFGNDAASNNINANCNGGAGGGGGGNHTGVSSVAGGNGGSATCNANSNANGILLIGGNGQNSLSQNTTILYTGTGASSFFGPGGWGVVSNNTNVAGSAATNPGSGGGGAAVSNTAGGNNGGNGANGLIIVYEYS
jgi:hypothetical protein